MFKIFSQTKDFTSTIKPDYDNKFHLHNYKTYIFLFASATYCNQ